jgi:hypothetical protein
MSQSLFNRERAAEIMQEYGGLSLKSWARISIQRGVFSEEFNAGALQVRAERELAKFSREDDEYGLPRFGRTTMADDDGDPIYAQRELWDRDSALLNIQARVENYLAAGVRTLKLVEWFEDRFNEPCPFRPDLDRRPGIDYGDDR